jgi:hypothetical protein
MMLDIDAMRAQLSALSSEAIAQVYDALHDCKDVVIHRAATSILWSRHAAVFADPGGKWEELEVELGNPNIDPNSAAWMRPRPRHLVVAFCSLAKDQHDPIHRVRRTLNWSYNDDRGVRVFSGIECTCGARSSDRLFLKRRQVYPTARVWPTVMMPDGIPHYQVCKNARCADDPDHAPDTVGFQCWCGAYLGTHGSGEVSDKFLPAY